MIGAIFIPNTGWNPAELSVQRIQQKTVPQAIIAFLESTDYEDAIRNAISLGGDSDTLACITGGIAEAFYGGVPDFIRNKVMGILDDDLRMVTERFLNSLMRSEWQFCSISTVVAEVTSGMHL